MDAHTVPTITILYENSEIIFGLLSLYEAGSIINCLGIFFVPVVTFVFTSNH